MRSPDRTTSSDLAGRILGQTVSVPEGVPYTRAASNLNRNAPSPPAAVPNRRAHPRLSRGGPKLALPKFAVPKFAGAARRRLPPPFYRDVLPILEQHCQSCHRPGSIAPMPFESYEQAWPFSGAIRCAVEQKTMPPWFADPRIGQFANDPSLSAAEISTLAAWSEANAPAGDKKDAAPARHWVESWSIPEPDLVLSMPRESRFPPRSARDRLQTGRSGDRQTTAAWFFALRRSVSRPRKAMLVRTIRTAWGQSSLDDGSFGSVARGWEERRDKMVGGGGVWPRRRTLERQT